MSSAPFPIWPARLENPDAPGRIVLVCEHASNHFPAEWGTLGLDQAQQRAHIAWDPGALGLARGLAGRLGAPVLSGQVSRLVYDCNRPPDAPGAMAERSEIHTIPGNQRLGPEARARRVAAVYLPFHQSLQAELMRRLALGLAPVLVTIHSFTPVYFGKSRSTEFGVIHDADPSLALAVMQAAMALPLVTRLNEPYSAADQVTHTLRLQATPHGLPNVMLEIRNDLIGTPAAQDRMADLLAPVLTAALAMIENGAQAPAITKTG